MRSGELGRLGMILSFNYTDFLYRPRRPERARHRARRRHRLQPGDASDRDRQADRRRPGASVRANAGILNSTRPTEGNCIAFLEFENGAAASLVYSAYDFFDSDEFHGWVAEGGTPKPQGRQGATRRALLEGTRDEADMHKDLGYGGRQLPAEQPHLPHFGTLIVTCERGDIRPSTDGILIYGPGSVREGKVERINTGSAMAMRLTLYGRRCGKIAATCIMRAGAGLA